MLHPIGLVLNEEHMQYHLRIWSECVFLKVGCFAKSMIKNKYKPTIIIDNYYRCYVKHAEDEPALLWNCPSQKMWN